MNKILNSKYFNNYYFCIFYLFTSFSFIICIKDLPLINLLPKIAIVWGGILALRNIICILKRKPTNVESFIILLLFITLVLNIAAYLNAENIKCWIVNLIMLCAVFYIGKEKDLQTIKKEILGFSLAYFIITFITSCFSILLNIMNKTYLINDFNIGGSNGVFSNENSLGISAAIAVLVSIFLFLSNKNKILKIIFVINIPIQIYALAVSTSRGALCIFVAILITLLLFFIKNTLIRYILLFLPAFATFGSLFLSHESMYYFTTGRNDLWLSAIKLLEKNYLIGIGNHDLVQKVRDIRSSIYLQGIATGGLHNIYIQILTTNGVFALITFICFIVISIFYILHNMNNKKLGKDTAQLFVLLSTCIGILLVNLFESNIFYIVSFISITLWAYMGYIISYIHAINSNESKSKY